MQIRKHLDKFLVFLVLFILICAIFKIFHLQIVITYQSSAFETYIDSDPKDLKDINLREIKFDADEEARRSYKLKSIRQKDLVFVGGFGRSGTTLMRIILDVHPNIRCGPETKILPAFTGFLDQFFNRNRIVFDLAEAQLHNETLNNAAALFIYHIMLSHGQNATRLCAKDPELLLNMRHLHQIFPNAKFIFMIRDGRAASYSLMLKSRVVVTRKSFYAFLTSWNDMNVLIDEQCDQLSSACLRVKYESLAIRPRETIHRVMRFLNESFISEQLEHERHIGSRVVVSQLEWSSDQILRPIYTDSIDLWRKKAPKLPIRRCRRRIPMLERFGYNLN